MTVVGILREEVDRDVVSQTNLALHGTGWTEQDGRRVIGYCRTAPQQSPEEAAEPLVAAWRQRLEGLAAVGIGGPSEQGLAESYRTACRQRTAAFSIRRERWCAGIRPLMCRSLTP